MTKTDQKRTKRKNPYIFPITCPVDSLCLGCFPGIIIFVYTVCLIGSKIWSPGFGRALKSFLNALGSSATKYQPKWSHGSPFQPEKLAGAYRPDLIGGRGGSPSQSGHRVIEVVKMSASSVWRVFNSCSTGVRRRCD